MCASFDRKVTMTLPFLAKRFFLAYSTKRAIKVVGLTVLAKRIIIIVLSPGCSWPIMHVCTVPCCKVGIAFNSFGSTLKLVLDLFSCNYDFYNTIRFSITNKSFEKLSFICS